MQRVALFAFACVLVLAPLALWARPAAARSLDIEDMAVEIEARADGTVLVEERIRVRFEGSWNGLIREIPYGYTYARHVRNQTPISVDAIEDDQGRPLRHEARAAQGYLTLKIWVPGARDATHTVVVRYHMQNVIRQHDYSDLEFGVRDELYWDVTGNESVWPIQHASAQVRLPEGIAPDAIEVTAYTGLQGEEGDAYLSEIVDGPAVRVETTASLGPKEGLTIVVLFPPGHLAYPTFWQKVGWWLRANWPVFVPVLLLLLWILAWWAWGRDPMARRTIIPEWEPPEGLRAAEVGVLVDDRLDQHDLTAAIVDLAVRGVLTIHEDGGSHRLELHPERFEKTKQEPFEKRLIHALFGADGTEVELSTLKYKFVRSLERIRDSALDHLVGTGFFERRPDRAMERWGGWAFLALIGLVVLGVWQKQPWPYWVVSALSVIGMFAISRHMPRRTGKGLDALARIRGMEEYLLTAEKDRMKTMPMDHFERLLPYAIALGLHERWAQAFAGLYDAPPDWYRTEDGRFDPHWVRSALRNMNRNVGATMMSGPRSQPSSGRSGWGGSYSGGGGFSGGSSGGGFGGGSVGGF